LDKRKSINEFDDHAYFEFELDQNISQHSDENYYKYAMKQFELIHENVELIKDLDDEEEA
jgi:hypothetical protein